MSRQGSIIPLSWKPKQQGVYKKVCVVTKIEKKKKRFWSVYAKIDNYIPNNQISWFIKGMATILSHIGHFLAGYEFTEEI